MFCPAVESMTRTEMAGIDIGLLRGVNQTTDRGLVPLHDHGQKGKCLYSLRIFYGSRVHVVLKLFPILFESSCPVRLSVIALIYMQLLLVEWFCVLCSVTILGSVESYC